MEGKWRRIQDDCVTETGRPPDDESPDLLGVGITADRRILKDTGLQDTALQASPH